MVTDANHVVPSWYDRRVIILKKVGRIIYESAKHEVHGLSSPLRPFWGVVGLPFDHASSTQAGGWARVRLELERAGVKEGTSIQKKACVCVRRAVRYQWWLGGR